MRTTAAHLIVKLFCQVVTKITVQKFGLTANPPALWRETVLHDCYYIVKKEEYYELVF